MDKTIKRKSPLPDLSEEHGIWFFILSIVNIIIVVRFLKYNFSWYGLIATIIFGLIEQIILLCFFIDWNTKIPYVCNIGWMFILNLVIVCFDCFKLTKQALFCLIQDITLGVDVVSRWIFAILAAIAFLFIICRRFVVGHILLGISELILFMGFVDAYTFETAGIKFLIVYICFTLLWLLFNCFMKDIPFFDVGSTNFVKKMNIFLNIVYAFFGLLLASFIKMRSDLLSWKFVLSIIKKVYSLPSCLFAGVILILGLYYGWRYELKTEGLREVTDDDERKDWAKYCKERVIPYDIYSLCGLVLAYLLSGLLCKFYFFGNIMLLIVYLIIFIRILKTRLDGNSFLMVLKQLIVIFLNLFVVTFLLSKGLIMNLLVSLIGECCFYKYYQKFMNIKKSNEEKSKNNNKLFLNENIDYLSCFLKEEKTWLILTFWSFFQFIAWAFTYYCSAPFVKYAKVALLPFGIPKLNFVLFMVLILLFIIIAYRIIFGGKSNKDKAPYKLLIFIYVAYLVFGCLTINKLGVKYYINDNGQEKNVVFDIKDDDRFMNAAFLFPKVPIKLDSVEKRTWIMEDDKNVVRIFTYWQPTVLKTIFDGN